ncbi:hypothetical protein SCNRRL3882_3578 [Streptomyces chartreusis NRRL 3882]|uniref:Uncharacterized protein n=1 Tax=Streptomyces chartreusis NRRL 3882 TaxID=1079985 RepID=A0A2N9B9U7_STRCX|nr:hypothetical protein SCNRRL3882_3578 [Streptomyces chartreusis NRRL 3882]
MCDFRRKWNDVADREEAEHPEMVTRKSSGGCYCLIKSKLLSASLRPQGSLDEEVNQKLTQVVIA